VTERIIEAADSAGAGNVQISLNRGVLPHEMFMEQIRRFARDVFPALPAHRVENVPVSEGVRSPDNAIAPPNFEKAPDFSRFG
jgi:hypothetical protein